MYHIVLHTDAPVQLIASISGPTDIGGLNLYIPKRQYGSAEKAKTIIGTIQSRAERYGFKFHGGIIIPYGVKPPKNKQQYYIKTPLKAQMGYVPPWENWELRSPYQRCYAQKKLEHPETIIIEPNEYYVEGLREADIVKYYATVKDTIVNFFKTHDVDGFVLIKTDKQLIIKRHANIEISGMRIDNPEAFNALNNGRVIEFHFAIGEMTTLIWLDIDPKDGFSWEDTIVITKELVSWMDKEYNGIRPMDIQARFSGKNGFHIIGTLSAPIPVNEARTWVAAIADQYIAQKKDPRLTTNFTREPNSIRIDYSTLHNTGGLRVPFSLAYPTGLVCMDVTEIQSFTKIKATIWEAMDQLPTVAAAEYMPGSLDDIITVWLKTKERALTTKEAQQLLATYHAMGFERFYEHVHDTLDSWIGEAQLYRSLEGQALANQLPIKFVANTLTEYQHKRNFQKTAEPKGETTNDKQSLYGIQRHVAKRAGLHYDLRLASGGVLKSWAIPKFDDILNNKKHTVLAIPVEDHPMEYLDFQGNIPEGSYGAGTVEIYDRGEYNTLSRSLDKWTFEITSGILKTARFSLIKTKDNKWLLHAMGGR